MARQGLDGQCKRKGAFSFQALGMVAAAVVGLFILKFHPENDAWRWMLASGAVPAILVMILRTTVPESARWYREHGHNKKAAQVNMGPNATTFILPAELFSTKVRASGHGFAAGAAIGIFFLPILKDNRGVPNTLYALAGVCLLGLMITLIFRVETKGRSLEELIPGEA